MATRFDGAVHVSGALSCQSISLPAGSVGNNQVAAGAGVAATKLEHQHRQIYAQPNIAVVAETKAVHVCFGATGTVVDFRAGSLAKAAGDATMTVDLHKNGASVLVSPIVLDSANTDRVAEAGTLNTTTLVAGDLLEVVVTVSAGTGTLGTGLFASLTVEEAPI